MQVEQVQVLLAAKADMELEDQVKCPTETPLSCREACDEPAHPSADGKASAAPRSHERGRAGRGAISHG